MVPNVHIGTINDLTSTDIPYLEMSEKKGIDFITSKVDKFDKNELVLGYHVPPFNSVNHLHLHIIYPRSKMGFWHRFIYSGNTWFRSHSELVRRLQISPP